VTRPIDESHDPALRSWVESANQPGSDFPIQNLPFGVFRRRDAAGPHRIGVAIGDSVLDLVHCRELGLLRELPADVQAVLGAPALNGLMALGVPAIRAAARRELESGARGAARAGGRGAGGPG
jgi:fumarylacetoacetase